MYYSLYKFIFITMLIFIISLKFYTQFQIIYNDKSNMEINITISYQMV